jgi:hypothetical protein
VSVLFLLFNCFCISYLKKRKKERYGIEYDVFVLVVFGVYKRKKGKGKKKKNHSFQMVQKRSLPFCLNYKRPFVNIVHLRQIQLETKSI